MPQPLHLDVAEFASADRWRWTLTDHAGVYLAHHEVTLDPGSARYHGLRDLPRYLAVQAAHDRRREDERRLIAELGDEVGARVLGTAIAQELRERARPSLVVRVRVPVGADILRTLPLEIARLDGAALSGVRFVFQGARETPPPVAPVGARLRILALFSVPPQGSALNLRRERQMLRRLVRDLAGTGRAVDLRVLQYGVTRKSLKDVLEEAEGWDVIHFSGHGRPGALALERPDGAADDVSSTDLADMLAQAGGRTKLVMLSACLSAAVSIEQSLRWLGLQELTRDAAPAAEGAQEAPTVAQALTQRLGCAVVAMRYAVEDEFASEFGRALYEQMLENGNALPEAARLALSHTQAPAGALSVAAPALFGARAAELKLSPPEGDGFEHHPELDFVPDPPEHFVGRVAALTRASAALARTSGKAGVLFHGMAGGGKTWCALELLHHHASVRRFTRFVWFAAPEPGKDIAPALRDFALAMERELPGFKMVHVVEDAEQFAAWLPRLTRLLAQNAVLVALDNVESLLSTSGQWLDARWAALVQAMLRPGGLSRLVLTSRVRPADWPDAAEAISVHALARDEAVLLARELPNLRRLLDGAAAGMTAEAQRKLVLQVLLQAQGHPKLLDLADKLAADPAKLAAELAKFDAANPVPAAALAAFLQTGVSQLDVGAFLASLRAWTVGITMTLDEPAQLAFGFICALEESDRLGPIIALNWERVWRALGRAAPVPDFAALLAALERAGLAERRATGDEADDYTLAIHPGVAEAGRAAAGAALQAAVDGELAATWATLMQHALDAPDASSGPMITRAGLAAFPYLARRGDLAMAAAMLEQSFRVDQSPAAIAAALPMARRIANATAGSEREARDKGLLARVLLSAGRVGEAEALLRAAIEAAAVHEDFATASAVAGDLANLLLDSGRAAAALEMVARRAEFTRRAGHGPWSQLADECMRLQILNELGKWDEVSAEVRRLRTHMATLPDPPAANDGSVTAWNVRETLLDTGRTAALRLEQWQDCLDLTAAIVASRQARGAPALERMRTRFNAYGPLLRLQRFAEARTLLTACLATFQAENAIAELGAAYSALADLEDKLGHGEAALRFEETGLRHKYAAGSPKHVAGSHFNYANYLTRHAAAPALALAHRLAAVLLGAAMQSGELASDTAALARDLRRLGPEAAAALPADLPALAASVERIEGVQFTALLRGLVPDDAAAEMMRGIVAMAREVASAAQDDAALPGPPEAAADGA